MKASTQIFNALVAKGYPAEHIRIEFETIRYFDTGREGGWTIELNDEKLDLPLDWGVSVDRSKVSGVYDIDFGFINAYSRKVVFEIIAMLPNYSSH